MTAIDILKWIVIGNAVVLVAQSIRVVSLYAAIYSLSPHDWKRQLPLHVWLMASAFGMYVAGTSYFLLIGTGHELSRLLIYGAAGFTAQYGLWNILKYDRRRYSTVTNFRDPE